MSFGMNADDLDLDIRIHHPATQKAIERLTLEEGLLRTVADMISANNAALLSDLIRLGVVDPDDLNEGG